MYKSEKEFFNKWVKPMLRNCKLHRIESAATAPGFPDSYAQGINCFIELKNVPEYIVNKQKFTVPWRPGQQAFAMQELMSKTFLTEIGVAYSKCSWTFMAVKDGVILIKHNKFFPDNKVEESSIFRWTKDIEYNLVTFLKIHGYVISINSQTSAADYRIKYIKTLLHIWGILDISSVDFTYEDWFDDGDVAWNSMQASDPWELENIAWEIYRNEVLNGKKS